MISVCRGNNFYTRAALSKIILFIIFLSCNVSFADETKVTELVIPVVKCSGEKDNSTLNIVIGEVLCKAAACQESGNLSNIKGGMSYVAQIISGSGGVKGIGNGVKTMLSNALKETRCFNIIDIEQTEKLRKMAAITGQEFKVPKINLYIDSSITAIDVEKSGGALAGGVIPILSMISTTKESAKVAFDLSVLNPLSAEVIGSKTFQADSSKSSWGFGAYVGAGAGGWSISKSVALDVVVREVVFSVANHLSETFVKDKIVERPNAEELKKKQEKSSDSNSDNDNREKDR